MDIRETITLIEVVALVSNAIALIVLFQLYQITMLQQESINKSTRQRDLLKLAVSRHIRSIYNRGTMHLILGIFNLWMMFRENTVSAFVVSFNLGLLTIIVVSTIISFQDIMCERRMSELLENESVRGH